MYQLVRGYKSLPLEIHPLELTDMLLLSLEMKYSFMEELVVMMTVIIIVYTGKHNTVNVKILVFCAKRINF